MKALGLCCVLAAVIAAGCVRSPLPEPYHVNEALTGPPPTRDTYVARIRADVAKNFEAGSIIYLAAYAPVPVSITRGQFWLACYRVQGEINESNKSASPGLVFLGEHWYYQAWSKSSDGNPVVDFGGGAQGEELHTRCSNADLIYEIGVKPGLARPHREQSSGY